MTLRQPPLDAIQRNTRRWFEYHCWESDQSADADLWHRTHQKVTVLDCENACDFGMLTRREREIDGSPLVYRIKFKDGYEGSAFEDELLYRKSQFSRQPAPKI